MVAHQALMPGTNLLHMVVATLGWAGPTLLEGMGEIELGLVGIQVIVAAAAAAAEEGLDLRQ
jgi:hypothetical protein